MSNKLGVIEEIINLGNHSHLLDTFAIYGLGFGILQVYIYIIPLLTRINKINGYYESQAILICIVFFMFFTLNVMTPSVGFAVYFIYPTTWDWIHGRR